MKLDRFYNELTPHNMLYLSEKEALSLIKSLTSQMISGDANNGRAEYYPNVNGNSEYFSVFVVSVEDSI